MHTSTALAEPWNNKCLDFEKYVYFSEEDYVIVLIFERGYGTIQ
jgi:hypothetical protein